MEAMIEQLYEPLVSEGRRLLSEHPTMVALLDPHMDPKVLERFLIQFCAMGAQMTEPVESWIRRAGERTRALSGLERVGELLMQHAKHEAGHHLLLMADARSLAKSWNARHGQTLDVEALLASPATPAINRYVELHETTIESDLPYGQVAIELEIERMSMTFGPQQIALCKRLLGPEIMKCLSFIEEHVDLDVGHTAYNRRLIAMLLEKHPDAAPRLARLGTRAIETYIEFFGECLTVAQREVPFRRSTHPEVAAGSL